MILRAAMILVLLSTPQDAAELVRNGVAKYQKRDLAGAIEDFNRAIELAPKEWMVYGLRGDCRKETGDLDGAILDFTKVLELNPSHALSYASRASAKNLKKDYDGAIQDYSEALRLAPRNSDHYVNRGAAKLAKDDYSGAIADCKKALEISPKESIAYQNMGIAQLAKKDFDAALAAFSKAIEIEPRWPSPFFERAKAAYRKGDYAAASKDADKAYKFLEAEDPDLHYLWACCQMALGNGKKAKDAFDLALKAAEPGWKFRAQTESLLSIVPELTKPSTVPFRQRMLEKGREVLSKGETDKAIEILEEAVRLDSKSPEVHEALVGAYLKRNDPNRGDRKRARILVFDVVEFGKGLSPQMQRHLNAVCTQILASLRWLAHHQMSDGRWSGESVVELCRKDGTPRCDGKGRASDLRATSLAVVAFVGAGFVHLSTDNYDTKPIGETVKKALQWMMAQQKADGGLGDPASERFLEDHAIATLAICEAYGVPVSYEPWKAATTQFLKGAAQRAVDFLVANRGAGKTWAVKARKEDPDPIATGWALFALQSARLAELKIPADAGKPGLDWLIGATFQAKPPRFDVAASFAVAAAACQGRDLDGDLLRPYLKAVSEAPPGKEPETRDTLVDFLSAEALRSGDYGALWQSWSDRAKATLKEVARLDDEGNGCPGGSWDAVGPADGPRGRVITTALNTLTLEICYGYVSVFCAPPPDSRKKRSKSADDYFQSGLQKQNRGDLDGAIVDYTKSIELHPSPDVAYGNRGLAKMDKGDLDDAIADFTKAIDLNPQFSNAYNNRGHAKRLKGDSDGALADLTMAIDLNPKDAVAYANRGQVKQNKGDLEGAIADCAQAIAIDPKNLASYRTRGYARYDQRSWADALADFRKICDLDPVDQDYSLIRIWLLRARLGERDAATRELTEVLKGRKADDWPGRILRFLAGDLPEAEFLKAAESEDAKTDREQKCEAFFYVGARSIIDGDKDKAKEYFQKCLDTAVKTFTEYQSASAELKHLGK